MNVNTYDENLCLFFQALRNVERKYVFCWQEAYKEKEEPNIIEQCERVYAYELYRQWENILENHKSEFVLNGEPSKHISVFDETKKEDRFPDLVLHHGQGKTSGHEIVCEIKRRSNIGNNKLEGDIDKLNIFTTSGYSYHWGILLIYGLNDSNCAESSFDIIREKYFQQCSAFSDDAKKKILIVDLKYPNDKSEKEVYPEFQFKSMKEILE